MPVDQRPPIVLLALLNAAAVADRMVFGALAPVVQPALRLSDAGLGLVQGPAFAVAYGLALPFAGRIVDRVGARAALIGSVLLWTLGLIVSASAASLAPLVLGRAITGIGQAALLPAGLSLILAGAAPGRAGRTIGLFTGAGTLGRGAAFAVAGMLLGLFGGAGGPVPPWSAVLLTLAGGNFLLLAALVARRRAGGAGAATQPRAYAVLWQRWRHAPRAIGAVIVAAVGAVIVAQALASWVAVTIVRTFAVPPATAAATIGLIGLVAGPLGALAGGVLADRPRRIARDQAIVTLLCAPAALAFARAPTPASAYAALAATMLLSGAAAAMSLVRFQRLIPPAARGTANGLLMALTSLVGIAGAPVLVAVAPLPAIGDRLALVVAGAAIVSALASIGARDRAAAIGA